VPKNLCAKIPDNVSDDAAAFTVIGAIGLQGVRLVKPMFGETVVVVGLDISRAEFYEKELSFQVSCS
jgi:threonine dehydrogenase-like Zn-dependent dehydrogenase